MKTTTIPKNKATLAATKRALHAMMKQDGLLFPETPEDVDRMEATVDDSRLPTKLPDYSFEITRLKFAIAGDFRSFPTAYPILAAHGFMERTANGYRMIDGEVVIRRCRELIAVLSAKVE